MNDVYDYVVVGAGIVGVSTAWQLQQRLPDKKILIVEKESKVGFHQTGHNSGVIHAGVYYAPDSLKAQFCREGLQKTVQFCKDYGIAYEQCGKLIVATNDLELERLITLYERCHQNQLNVEWLDAASLNQREPNISGIAAILVHDTGIADYPAITQQMALNFQGLGGEIKFDCQVIDLTETAQGIELNTHKGVINAHYLISCSGLMSDRLAGMLNIPIDFAIVPFRGEYYRLPKHSSFVKRHLIYPVPDPDLPFLGVHLTRMIDGSVTVGPNAVLGWKREGYGAFNMSARDTRDLLLFKGTWRLMLRYFKTAVDEMWASLWKPRYLKQVQKYCPSVGLKDLEHYPAGIRAQAVKADGSLVHDFLFVSSQRSFHVCNAPSPAATSAMPIGHYIVEQVLAKDHR